MSGERVLPVAPERFLKAFQEAMAEAKFRDATWRAKFSSDKAWTPFMVDVLIATGKNLGFMGKNEIGKEWMRLDMSYFSFPERKSNPSSKLWNLEVAIEHENYAKDWVYEWIKMAHIRCGLKVLISYYDSKEGLKALQDEAEVLYKGLSYKAVAGEERWLLIFGPTGKVLGDGCSEWLAYAFGGAGMIRNGVWST